MRATNGRGSAGFTLVEMLIAMVVGGLLITSLFKVWRTNQRETDRIQTKSDFRDRATLATTALNRSITMAGFGMSKMDVITRASGSLTDTLLVYSNSKEIRTTLNDTARLGATEIRVFKDSGFTVGGLLGITDSLNHEYLRISDISGDSAHGYVLRLSSALGHKYLPGVPDIYPVQKERFYVDGNSHSLVRIVDGKTMILAGGMTDFRVSLRNSSGGPATSWKNIRVVTFEFTGSYKAPAGTPSQMRFSSTVIPRNIL